MGVGIFNVAVGVAMVVGGFNGYTILGTSSWEGLVGFGVLIVGLGVYQIVQSRRGR